MLFSAAVLVQSFDRLFLQYRLRILWLTCKLELSSCKLPSINAVCWFWWREMKLSLSVSKLNILLTTDLLFTKLVGFLLRYTAHFLILQAWLAFLLVSAKPMTSHFTFWRSVSIYSISLFSERTWWVPRCTRWFVSSSFLPSGRTSGTEGHCSLGI